jgi:Ca2+-binding RTX toxin-like protein
MGSELYGGTGNDTYVVNAGDSIFESAGQGIDTVITSLSAFTLPDNFENLTASEYFSYGLIGIGNALANVITGSYGDDVLDGGAGAADTLIGGNGDDTYIVRTARDVVIEIVPYNGTDTVQTDLAVYTLPPNVEQLIYTGNGDFVGVNNTFNNGFITSGPGNDTLTITGYGGRLQGGAGNDSYFGVNASTVIVENAGEGIDTVYALGGEDFTLASNLENFFWTGGSYSPRSVRGNASDNVIVMQGTTTDRYILSGFDGNDTLTGGNFGGRFIGGNGNDIMTGSRDLAPDNFVFVITETGVDRIIGFQPGTDSLLLAISARDYDFIQGPGTAATREVLTFFHDPVTGLVSYDLDGTGAGAAVPLAFLDTGLTLSITDFFFS